VSFKNPKQFYATFFSAERKDSFGLTSSPPLHLPGGGGVRALVKKERKRVLGIINAVAEGA